VYVQDSRKIVKKKIPFKSGMKEGIFFQLQTNSNDRVGRTMKLNLSSMPVELGVYWKIF